MSVKQNLFVSVFVHKCLMMLNDVEYTTFKMFVMQMTYYLFVISFQLMFHKTLRYCLAGPLPFPKRIQSSTEFDEFDLFDLKSSEKYWYISSP